MSAARRQTSLLSDAPIARDLQKPGFDFRVMQHEPVTVYVILPFGKLETYGRWLRLVVTSALQAVMSANAPAGCRCCSCSMSSPRSGVSMR